MMASASLGIPLWGVTNGILIPFLSSRHMAWDAAAMKDNFARLLVWILFGTALGVLLQAFSQLAAVRFGPEVAPTVVTPASVKRIVILGGGFAGMKTAESLEEQFAGDSYCGSCSMTCNRPSRILLRHAGLAAENWNAV
jgi:hypothetical protein